MRTQRDRRFIHDQGPRVEIDRARNRHRLPLITREGRHRFRELFEVRVQPRYDLAALGLHRVFVDKSKRRHKFASEEQVRGGIQIIRQCKRPIDCLDIIGPGIALVPDLGLFALDIDTE